jgi:hypothetical protein
MHDQKPKAKEKAKEKAKDKNGNRKRPPCHCTIAQGETLSAMLKLPSFLPG